MSGSWPSNSPDSLDDLCLKFCIDHGIFTGQDVNTGYFYLKPGVFLPGSVCDKILTTISHKSQPVQEKLLGIFEDTERTKLSRVCLRDSKVKDDGLQLICKHPLIELDLSRCQELTENSIKYINGLSSTLRVLRLEGNVSMLGALETAVARLIDGTDHNHHGRGDSSSPDIPLLSVPQLRVLHLRDYPFSASAIFREVMSTTLWPLTRLTHLDLSASFVNAEQLDFLEKLQNLVSFVLADVPLPNLTAAVENICKLRNLRHLDLSQGSEDIEVPIRYDDPEWHLQYIVQNLPSLESLDISGTNLAGFEKAEEVVHRLGPGDKLASGDKLQNSAHVVAKVKEVQCSIPGLEGKNLEFLGLLDCAHSACYREHIPAKRVTGDNTEEQVLLSVQVYLDRGNLLTRALNHLFRLFRYSTVKDHCAALEGILSGMQRHLLDKHVQISGSASLFYIVKGEQKDHITQKQRRKIIDCLLDGMECHMAEQTMMRNGCLTLCHFELPQEVLYCYKRLVEILLKMLEQDMQEEFIQRIGIYLLNCLACQVDGQEKKLIGDMGAITTMLNIIRKKLNSGQCDEIMEVAWSTMWNVTDETACNCDRFMEEFGMDLFLKCLKLFPEKPELLRNMMGLMGNIAEVKVLRPRLMREEYVRVFSDLLLSKSDGIEVSYNAAGVISHMAADGPQSWPVDTPRREDVMANLVEAIERWPLDSKRNINYRSFEPILRLLQVFDTPAVQHWAVWALCNLTKKYPDKYCSLLEKEGGLQYLQEVLSDPRPNSKIKELARMILTNIQEFKDLPQTPASDNQPENNGMDVE